MHECSVEDGLVYQRISQALVDAIKPGDPVHVVSSVLLKHLIAMLIKGFGPDRAITALSEAINDCMEDLKENKLI